MSQDAGKKKTTRGKTQKTKPERLKCSLLLTRENDLRLTVLASLRNKDRSTLLNELLDDCLRGVVVSLRGLLATDSGTDAGAGAGDRDPDDAAESDATAA
jgi:hypothetical protein